MAADTALALIKWRTITGPLKMWDSDIATRHFKHGFMFLLAEAFTTGGAYKSVRVMLVVLRVLRSSHTKRI